MPIQGNREASLLRLRIYPYRFKASQIGKGYSRFLLRLAVKGSCVDIKKEGCR